MLDDRVRLEVDDRLRVEDKAVLVESVANAPDPVELLKLALDPKTLGRSLGDVVEDPPLKSHPGPYAAGRRCRRPGIDPVAAGERVVVDVKGLAASPNVAYRALLHRAGRAIGPLEVEGAVGRSAEQFVTASIRGAARRPR